MLELSYKDFFYHRQALSNVYNLLKPKGAVLISFSAIDPYFEVHERLSRLEKYAIHMKDVIKFVSPYQHDANPVKTFKNLISEVGLQAKNVELRETSFTFTDRNHFWSDV